MLTSLFLQQKMEEYEPLKAEIERLRSEVEDNGKRIAFVTADVFLRINGWRLHRAPMQIHDELIQMFESGTFDFAHLEPWLRGFAEPST